MKVFFAILIFSLFSSTSFASGLDCRELLPFSQRYYCGVHGLWIENNQGTEKQSKTIFVGEDFYTQIPGRDCAGRISYSETEIPVKVEAIFSHDLSILDVTGEASNGTKFALHMPVNPANFSIDIPVDGLNALPTSKKLKAIRIICQGLD